MAAVAATRDLDAELGGAEVGDRRHAGGIARELDQACSVAAASDTDGGLDSRCISRSEV